MKYCTNCKEDRSSKYDAGCYGSCGKRNCKNCCASCGEHTLIETAVVKVSNQLGISRNNPFLNELQRLKNMVDEGEAKEITATIEQATVSGYCGPKRFIIYNKYMNEFRLTVATTHIEYY
jgi:hypothetical protein